MRNAKKDLNAQEILILSLLTTCEAVTLQEKKVTGEDTPQEMEKILVVGKEAILIKHQQMATSDLNIFIKQKYLERDWKTILTQVLGSLRKKGMILKYRMIKSKDKDGLLVTDNKDRTAIGFINSWKEKLSPEDLANMQKLSFDQISVDPITGQLWLGRGLSIQNSISFDIFEIRQGKIWKDFEISGFLNMLRSLNSLEETVGVDKVVRSSKYEDQLRA